MKRILSLLMLCVLLTAMFPYAVGAQTDAPTRVINLVYDDSGSMIETNEGELVDTWCQAKYAIEVFAAMLGEKDTMNVYVMSDFNYTDTAEPELVINGADGTAANVKKVHDMITYAGNTSFDSVRKAYTDLKGKTADEKWLVILTDGIFQKVDNIDLYFTDKATDIRVMFLGMGPSADGLTADTARDIYEEKAENNDQILTKITDICTRIFNSDRLEVHEVAKTFAFDVPMGELVVFAQGANVSINGIRTADGTLVKSTSTPVTVKYSEVPSLGDAYPDFIVNRDLLGSIAVFKGDFDAGTYTADVSGAETIEVYYKPNVEIAAYLKDSQGNEVTDLTELEAGEYTIEFGFVKGGTAQRVEQSSLLGDVTYEARVTSNGTTHEKTYNTGDVITLEEGSLDISVVARYLDYNTVSTDLSYDVYKNKEIAFTLTENPTYTLVSEGFTETPPMALVATVDGQPVSEEQWAMMGVPSVEPTSSLSYSMGDFTVEKSDTPGIYHVTPTLKDGKLSGVTYEDFDVTVAYHEQVGSETWSGTMQMPVDLQDDRPWPERHRDLFIFLLIMAALLFLIIGYVGKAKLPKALKKEPLIQADPTVPGNEPQVFRGKLQYNLLSIILPYRAQRATLCFVPFGVCGVPDLQLRGVRGKKMMITNTDNYAGLEAITFDNRSVPEKSEKLRVFASCKIMVEDTEWTYTCYPNRNN